MKKDRLTTVILVIVFLTGLSLLLYPSVANYWNSMHSSKAITNYTQVVDTLSPEERDAYLQEARDYNAKLAELGSGYVPSEEELEKYHKILNIAGDGVMGYIEIPTIDVSLPVYHGTSDEILQTAVGHLEWSSLPVGGTSTHCVLSGHRGLPSAKLFTHLDKLVVGDVFMISVLDEVLCYEVDQILIVEPKDTEALRIEEGKDYCTLVTCTPYGINTHRMLVRGHRIDNADLAASMHITGDAVQVEPMIVASIIGLPIILIFTCIIFIRGGKKKRRSERGGRV